MATFDRIVLNFEAAGANAADAKCAPFKVPTGFIIDDVKVISDTSTATSDGSNYYTVKLDNVTDTTTIASYATYASAAAQDLSADTEQALTVTDAYRDIAKDDVLRAWLDATGSPADLSSGHFRVVVYGK